MTTLAQDIAALPDAAYDEFWDRLLNEYRALCDDLGDDHGTDTFQQRMDQRAKEHTR